MDKLTIGKLTIGKLTIGKLTIGKLTMTKIELAICTQCDKEHGYSQKVYEHFQKRHPRHFTDNGVTDLVDNHPLLVEFENKLLPHKALCLVINDEYALCQMHLEMEFRKLSRECLRKEARDGSNH